MANTILLNEQKIASINEFHTTRINDTKNTINTQSAQILQLNAKCEKAEAEKAVLEAKLKEVHHLAGARKREES